MRWFVGNTIAENLNNDERALDTARLALALAPDDPLTHWTLAAAEQKKLTLERSRISLAEYDQAARLAPNDYRFWLALGRALEQAGDGEKAERAMRRAVALAPAYSYPRWYLGNLLLRRGNEAEAFDQLRQAGETDPALQSQVFNLAWEVYGKEPAELAKAIGSAAAARAGFAKYLIERKEIAAGLNLWSGLSASEKQANRAVGESLIKVMIESQRFAVALQLANDLAVNESMRGVAGQLMDGGLEQNINAEGAGTFGWQIKAEPQVQASLDQANPHGGARSLRLVYKARTNIDPVISQLVVVEPNTQYDFSVWVKTNKLESAGLPVVEILDAANGAVLVSSEQAPGGTNDWQRSAISFKSGSKSEAVVIRINRASCGDNPVCPIFGTAWYDDFDLRRRS